MRSPANSIWANEPCGRGWPLEPFQKPENDARSRVPLIHLRASVLKRWQEGEQNGLVLWREIQKQGYTGSERTVYRHIETRHSGERSDFSQSQSSPHLYS